MVQYPEFTILMDIMEKLLSPDGCPWDREQTHDSLIKYLREESFEVIEAILSGNDSHLCEELGDLILQVVFHAVIAKQRHAFDIRDVLNSINKKMKLRHPHVFDPDHLQDSPLDEQWEKIKKSEKNKTLSDAPSGKFHSIPDSLSPWLAAERMQLIAAKDGFDWPDVDGILDKIIEECEEFRVEHKTGDRDKQKEEMGDMLFAMINLCRFLKMDPSELIFSSGNKFKKRYDKMVELANLEKPDISFKKLSLNEKETFWQKAKYISG